MCSREEIVKRSRVSRPVWGDQGQRAGFVSFLFCSPGRSRVMLKSVKNFLREEEGATMVEYGLMVALIAVACITAVTVLGGGIRSMFEGVGDTIENTPTEAPGPTT